MSPLCIFAGFGVGLLVGMTVVGGGSLMTPLLTLLFGVSPAVAVGTDLAFSAITKGVGTVTHRLNGTVQWPIVQRLCIGALPAAFLATLALSHSGTLNKAPSNNLLRVAFSACDARRTPVRLRFSAETAAARDGFSRSL